MSWFKKRKKNEIIGKGSDRTITLFKEFEVFNCTPLSYAYSTAYSNFLTSAEGYFRKVVDKTSVDDLNCDMFDNYIQSITDEMKASAMEQFTYHLQMISHHKGLVEGELIRASKHRENLRGDLVDIEHQIEKYRKHKEVFSIH